MSPRGKAALALAAVFIAGLALGSLGALAWMRREIDRRRDSAQWTPRTMAWLERGLDLDARQRAEALPAVERSITGFTAIRSEGVQRSREILLRLAEELEPSLTPPQRERLRALVAERVAAWTRAREASPR